MKENGTTTNLKDLERTFILQEGTMKEPLHLVSLMDTADSSTRMDTTIKEMSNSEEEMEKGFMWLEILSTEVNSKIMFFMDKGNRREGTTFLQENTSMDPKSTES